MRFISSLFIMLFILSGCYLQEPTKVPVETLTIPPIIEASKEVTRPTIMPTLEPSSTSPASPTITNTPLPVVTMTKDEAMTIIDVLEGSPGCKLPCWLGLTPGRSTVSDIQGFAEKLGMNFLEDRYNQEEDVAFFHVSNTENYKKNPSNIEGNPTSVEVYWQKEVIKSIVILPNEVPAFLSVKKQRSSLGDPDDIFLMLPYGKTMGFILDYRSHGFVFSVSSITSKQETMCLGDSLDKVIKLQLYDPDDPVDIQNQVDLYGDLVWKTQPDPGYTVKEIMNRIVSKECLHFLDFSKQR